MLTKYKLITSSKEYELQADDLRNWAEVKCIYKRSEYSGVVRSFTSKFEFANTAYDILMDEFNSKGYMAKAKIELYVIDNNWNYHLEYASQLDFASMTYTEYVMSMNAIDDSIESVIKANKSTKYEFIVGEDIPVYNQFLFDRLKIIETATYAISDGESQDDGSLSGMYDKENNYRIMVGLTGNEIGVGKAINPQEDQEYGEGCMIIACRPCSVTLNWSINVNKAVGCAELILMKGSEPVKVLHEYVTANPPIFSSDFQSIEAVMNHINNDFNLKNRWATEDWSGDWVNVNGIVWEVEQMNGRNQWTNTGIKLDDYRSDKASGSVTFNATTGDRIWLKFNSEVNRPYYINSSSLKFSWENRGDAVALDGVRPNELLEVLLAKIGVGCDSSISDYDPRIANTIILPAESVRKLPGAKLYASFNDFCKWMETVFGYVYVYNEDAEMIQFLHREELFSKTAPVVDIDGAKDFEFSTESSVLYSSVVIGYEKKDYESVNGRDEFNFNTTYTTGYTNNGKKLELKSPFRADSYGIEFLVEKQGEDTTDNTSDKDVFFTKVIEKGGYLRPDRTATIENSLTGTMLNGDYSPMNCVGSNAEYISMMTDEMQLLFASTDGNAGVRVNNIGVSDDLWLTEKNMLTPGELKFTCYEQNIPQNINCLIRVKSADYIYTGYIRQVEFMLARPEAVSYTIMIKTKTPCS